MSDRAKTASPEEGLSRLREAIDRVDRQLLKALNERALLVRQVGTLKAESGLPVYSPARERDLATALIAGNPGPFPDEGIAPVFREIVSATRSLERRLRVAFLGPEGTYGHQAAEQHFGACVDFVPVGHNGAIFESVERGEVDRGVVPVENTTQGIVTEAFDALASTQVAIGAETSLEISHCLLNQSGRLEDVRVVLSHPQALGQCRRWLQEQLPGVEQQECASTAGAAKSAAADAGVAAIASARAGQRFGLSTAAKSIEDQGGNITRFLVIGGECPPSSGDDLTLVIYDTAKSEPGALYRLLGPFSEAGINLSAIQSRPIPGRPWEYRFYLDFEGHRDDARIAKALERSRALADSCRVLGSFPRAPRRVVNAGDADQRN
jgi:chorismate mutase/prephenate dehydratase